VEHEGVEDPAAAARGTAQDERAARRRDRRRSWYGAKRHVKRAASVPVVSPVLHAVVGARRGTAAASRLPAPLTVRRVTGRVAGHEFTMLSPARCVVAKELYWGGGRRPGGADQLALEVFARLVPGARTVLDVGAYTGVFSLVSALAEPAARVHAFELVPANAVALLDNLLANDLLPHVEVHLAGVGRDGGVLRVPSGRGGSALPDFLSSAGEVQDGVLVPTTSLDALLDRTPGGTGATVVKIDVEGAEGEVLACGRRLLEHSRPDVLCELLPGADARAVERALEGLGYRALLVADDALVEHRRPRADPVHRDWLLTTRTPRELAERGVPVRGRDLPTP